MTDCHNLDSVRPFSLNDICENVVLYKVITCLRNLVISGNLTVAGVGNVRKFTRSQENIWELSCRGKLFTANVMGPYT